MEKLEYTGVGFDHGLDALIFDHYGYWYKWAVENKRGDGLKGYEWFPRWYQPALKEARDYLKAVKPAEMQLEIPKVERDGRYFVTTYRISDKANPQVQAWESRVQTNTEEEGRKYAEREFGNLSHLYEGDNAAWLHTQRTGVPVRPAWNTNKIDSFGYKWENGKITETYIPNLAETTRGIETRQRQFRPKEEKIL